MRLILAGATGLVGRHVLARALADPRVTHVVAPTRRPLPAHPNLDAPLVDFDALPADVYVGAAAVADFTPAGVATSKIKKRPGEDGLTLQLVRTRDILAEVAAHAARPRVVVGFAAETDDVDANARLKLAAKEIGRASCRERV